MGTTIAPAAVAAQSSAVAHSFAGANDRRRRKRAKISAQVHVRFTGSSGDAEETCTSVDVSRDGLLFLSTRSGYAVGQSIDVTFPYSAAAAGLNKGEPAEIVRVTEQPGNRFAVAVQFAAAKTGVARTGAAAAAATAQSAQTQHSVVLAVEPDQRTAEVMRTTLQPDGYNVIVVSTANEALEVLKSTVPAVLVAEVEAKDMSGQ
ncbi:MAG TPA: PilZ domain-containing protein, partial [Candidatus Acidoferrum sp.]|nr:PilZ domain-containing protein [Candidatus Acidoferrum sp.]